MASRRGLRSFFEGMMVIMVDYKKKMRDMDVYTPFGGSNPDQQASKTQESTMIAPIERESIYVCMH